MILERLAQPIARDPARQVMDVVDADIGREPAQHRWQVVVRGALQGAGVEAPVALLLPIGVSELVLHEEQPDARRSGEQGDRELNQQEVLDADINPMVASHGGVIKLIDVKDNQVFIQMGGGCQGCGQADVTLKFGIENAIRAAVPGVGDILDVTDHASGRNPYYTPSKK